MGDPLPLITLNHPLPLSLPLCSILLFSGNSFLGFSVSLPFPFSLPPPPLPSPKILTLFYDTANYTPVWIHYPTANTSIYKFLSLTGKLGSPLSNGRSLIFHCASLINQVLLFSSWVYRFEIIIEMELLLLCNDH